MRGRNRRALRSARAFGGPRPRPHRPRPSLPPWAGTTSRYSWGNDLPTPKQANFGDVGKTTEIGSYPANPWGLHDMNGNVWEWVEDCWTDSYTERAIESNIGDGAFVGSAWTSGDCSRRVLRGGSWGDSPEGLRSADRGRYGTVGRSDYLGFRVARTLLRSES